MSMRREELKPGHLYTNRKNGSIYKLLYLAQHADPHGLSMAVYERFSPRDPGKTVWVRPIAGEAGFLEKFDPTPREEDIFRRRMHEDLDAMFVLDGEEVEAELPYETHQGIVLEKLERKRPRPEPTERQEEEKGLEPSRLDRKDW